MTKRWLTSPSCHGDGPHQALAADFARSELEDERARCRRLITASEDLGDLLDRQDALGAILREREEEVAST
jgi:hypothetical protein